MTFPYSGDLDGERVVRLAGEVFRSPKIFASSDRHLVFVCGGDSKKVSLRSQFLDFAKKELPHLRLILAEDAYVDLMGSSKPNFVNLMVFEDLVADLADCVVLFPESIGSAAELGFFAGKDKITKKLLTANPIAYQGDDSFLNLGPIALVNSSSNFKPTVVIENKSPLDFSAVGKRLERFSGAHRRMSFSHKEFDAYSPLERLFAIFEAVRHLRIVHVATLPYVIQKIFEKFPEKNEFKHLVSILIAAKYIERTGDDSRFLVATNAPPFLEIPQSKELLIAGNEYLLGYHRELFNQTFAALASTP